MEEILSDSILRYGQSGLMPQEVEVTHAEEEATCLDGSPEQGCTDAAVQAPYSFLSNRLAEAVQRPGVAEREAIRLRL